MDLKRIPKEVLNRRAYTANSYTDFLLSQLRKDWIIEPEKDFAWRQDQEIYEKVRLDSRYRAVEETLLTEIASLEWNLKSENKDPRVSQIYEWIIGKIASFSEGRLNLARAVPEGMSVQEMVWGWVFEKAPGDTKKRRWLVPKRLRHVSRDRLRRSIHMDASRKSWWVWRIFDPYLNEWIPIADETRYIWSFYRATEENLGYGEGLIKSVYSIVKLKVVLMELLAAGAERWVDSWIIVELDETLKETDELHNDESVTELLQDIAEMRANGVLALQNAKLQVSPAGQSTTAQAILEMIEKIDREITVLLTASNLPTDIQGGGSYAASQTQADQQNKRLFFQRRSVIEEPLTDYLLPAIRKWNKANFKALGMRDHETPYFQLFGWESTDTQERSQVFDLANRLGVEINEDDFRTQLKLAPVSGGKVIKPPQQPQDMGGLGGFGRHWSPEERQKRGFSENAFPGEEPPLQFSQAAILEDMDKADQKEEYSGIEESIKGLGAALLNKSLGAGSKEELKAAQDDFSETIRKTLLYYDLLGREEILKGLDEEEAKE